MTTDKIDPGHYSRWSRLIGCEPKDIAGELPYHPGTALVYIMRAGHKVEDGESKDEAALRDYRKAIRHIEFEVARISGGRVHQVGDP